MRNLFCSLVAASLMLSCTQHQKETAVDGAEAKVTTQDFFPVTSYIQGEIVDIRNNGVNPLMITTIGERMDSAWLKVEDLNLAFKDFLAPVIDSSTMWAFFKETKFLDQTINAYTFTYEPKTALPDSVTVQRWDVHINPQANTVKRIYIEKVNEQDRDLRLTWQSKEWCKIITLSPADTVEKEVLIKWRFE